MTGLTYGDAVAQFDPVFGIEVHIELNTATKMFCGCLNEFGAEPNTHVCPVCLGLPGSMPVTNGKAVESAVRLGLAPEDGLPVGFQILAPAHEDARLYRVGGALEALLTGQWGGPLSSLAPALPTHDTEVAR